MKRLESLITIPLIAIFCFALAIRVTYNFTVAAAYYPLHDSLTYQNIANNILHEHCYCLYSHLPTVDRAPLWPFIIALVDRIIGPQDIFVRLLLCVIGSGTCVLLYLFGKDVFGARVGIITGFMGAIYPFLYMYDGLLYSESVYIFLLLAFCYTLYSLQRKPHVRLMITSGILIGLLSLTRPNGLALLALFVAWASVLAWRKVFSWRIALKSVLIVSLLSFVFIAPWTLRNYKITHTLIPVAVGDGKVLLGAYNYETADPIYQHGYYSGVWIIPSESTPWIAEKFSKDCSGLCEVKRDNAYKAAALQWIESHISYMPFMIGQHFVNTWQTVPQEADLAINRFPDQPSSQFVVMMMETMTPILFGLALLGLLVTYTRWRDLLFFYLIIGLTLAQDIVYYGIPRFRAPIEPFTLFFAASTLWWLATYNSKRIKARQAKNRSTHTQNSIKCMHNPVFLSNKKPDSTHSLSRSSGSISSSSSSSSSL
jgi:4-amino-4-deoxy-L-arabinose transferase-like glycosyltransferase